MSAKTTLPSRPKPKGILKKPSAPAAIPSPDADQPPNQDEPGPQPLARAQRLEQQERAARLRLLQKLRDTELKPAVPLETFEALSQFPRSSQPAHAPSAEDAAYVLRALAGFTPSEYMDLVEERNCVGRCGYALCGRARRAHEGPYKLRVRHGAVARTADLNRWCSDACARRALHLKVQLDNPSYVRVDDGGGRGGRLVVRLELRDEDAKGDDHNGGGKGPGVSAAAAAAPRGSQEDRTQLAQAMAQLEIDKQRKTRRDAAALASERGDGGVFDGVSRVQVNIKENAADGPAEPPAQGCAGTESLIEGYRPTFGAQTKPQGRAHDSDDDDDDLFTVRF